MSLKELTLVIILNKIKTHRQKKFLKKMFQPDSVTSEDMEEPGAYSKCSINTSFLPKALHSTPHLSDAQRFTRHSKPAQTSSNPEVTASQWTREFCRSSHLALNKK